MFKIIKNSNSNLISVYRCFSIFAITLIIAVTIFGCKGFDHLTMVNETFPKAESCKECHIEIYKEWAASRHAKAYSNAAFQRATHYYQFKSCLGCHTPEPAILNEKPEARNIYPDEGVTCSSCHLEESKMTGPVNPTGMLAPHPMNVNEERYRSSKFCGRCHEGTFKEWQNVVAEKKLNCQECHMPSIKRKLTQAKNFVSKMIVSMEKEVLQKQHTFAIHNDLSEHEPFHINIKKVGNDYRLILQNNIPHSVPTGDFGVRVVNIEIIAVKNDNTILSIKKIELIKEINTAIPPQSSISWDFSVPSFTKTIRCVITRNESNSKNTQELFQIEVPVL